MDYITLKEASQKWNVTPRQINYLCTSGRIPGAVKMCIRDRQYGTENLSAYLRKMALDGYVVKLELPELKELVSLMRRSSNNLNQLDVYKRQVNTLLSAI